MKLLRFLSFPFLVLALTLYCAAGRLGAQPGNEPCEAVVGADGMQRVDILAGDYFLGPATSSSRSSGL